MSIRQDHMPALLLTGPASLHYVDVPRPTLSPDEVLVQVDLVGVCGSEVHDSKNPRYRQPPLVMGHEIVGQLVDGTRVGVDPLIACGTCLACRSGRTNVCSSRNVVGIHRAGGFAPLVAVPRAQLVGVPSTLTDAQAVMAEPLANGLHAWTLSGARSASRVGVLGAGPVGLSVALVAMAQGASDIALVEPLRPRLESAAAIGMVARDRLPAGCEVVFDCVGSAAAHSASLDALADGGTALWLGLTDREPNFDSTALVRSEKTIRGSYGYTRDEFERALALASAVPPAWVHERPLADGPAVFESLWRGELGVPKIALRPEHLKEGTGART